MDPFQDIEWLLAAEVAALLGEAARWDWSENQQRAARAARELAGQANAGRDLTELRDLFDELYEAIDTSSFEWFYDHWFGSPKHLASSDGEHGLDRSKKWWAEAREVLDRLFRLQFPTEDPKKIWPPSVRF